MTPPVTNMDQKVITMPQVVQAAPPVERRRRGVWVAVGVVLAALILGGAVLGAVAIHNNQRPAQSFEVGVAYGERSVPEHVTVDYKKQIIYVNEERYGQLGGLHHLHHFDRRLTAIRDSVNSRCYITPQRGSFQKVVNWYSAKDGQDLPTTPQAFRFLPQPIDKDVLQALGGDEIANHCSDLPSHWILPQLNEKVPAVEANNKTVDFQCSNGGEFDLDTSTCNLPQGRAGVRQRRAERDILIVVIIYSDGSVEIRVYERVE